MVRHCDRERLVNRLFRLLRRDIEALFRIRKTPGLATSGERSHAEYLRKELGSCPVCFEHLNGLTFTKLGFTDFVVENQPELGLMLTALNEHRWNEVMAFGKCDIPVALIQAFAFRCGVTRRLGWFTVVYEFDSFLPPEIYQVEALNEEDSRSLEAEIPSECWVRY